MDAEMKTKVEQTLAGMAKQMNGKLSRSEQLAAEVMPEMILEHAANNAYAMPKEGGALDNETRTLIYLGIALATNSMGCIESMMNKARVLNIPKDKILETFKIARFAQATHVMGNAEKVFQHLKDEW
ncbi:MAG: carboxymuconolactone decarboxylase family protein [Anaerolineales bacterium]